jgi:glycine oxidase
MIDAIIVGQGLAGSAVAWTLKRAGMDVVVIDSNDNNSASKISAGLVTPYSGKRQAKDSDFDRRRQQAKAFYEDVGKQLGMTLWLDESSVRRFQDQRERDDYRAKSERNEVNDTEQVVNERGETVGYRMLSAARVMVSRFLAGTREVLRSEGRLIEGRQKIEEVRVSGQGIEIKELKLVAKRIIFCQGFAGRENPWFPNIPDGPVRGEILEIALPAAESDAVQHHKHWLAKSYPAAEACEYRYLVGATYDRDDLHDGVTFEGRLELTEGARLLTSQPYEIVNHQSAVRAAMRDRKHRVLRSTVNPNVYLVNGMGSRGSLLAPVAASELLTMIQEPAKGREHTKRTNLTELAHKIVRRVVKADDIVVDATAGNGNDTEFLAGLLGENGKVIAIDIQPAAVLSTTVKLSGSLLGDRVSIHQESHAKLGERLTGCEGTVAAVMFNLGYLPGGDKTVITEPGSTRQALEAAVNLLRPQGVVTLIAYRGHDGGRDEAATVAAVAEEHRGLGYDVEVIESDPSNERSPVMTVIRRGK